jgi:hypothetical protein
MYTTRLFVPFFSQNCFLSSHPSFFSSQFYLTFGCLSHDNFIFTSIQFPSTKRQMQITFHHFNDGSQRESERSKQQEKKSNYSNPFFHSFSTTLSVFRSLERAEREEIIARMKRKLGESELIEFSAMAMLD